MKTKILISTFASSLILLSGCVAPQQQVAPAVAYISKDVPLNRVKGAIIDVYLADGWRLERESDHLLTFVVENKNMLNRVFSSSQYESRVFNRESVVISEGGDGTTLRANQEIITNYGSAFERAEPVSPGQAQTARFASIKSRL